MPASRKKKIRRAFAGALQNVFLAIGGAVVPLLSRRAERGLARFIAWFCRQPCWRFRRYAEENINLVYGDSLSEEGKERLLRDSFFSTALVLTDYFWFARHVEERLARHCVCEDPAMKRWIEGDFPGVFITAHIGNWELAGLSVAASGRRLWSVFKPLGSRAVVRRMRRFRGESGQRVIPREGAMRGILRALRDRDVVALLLDQHVDIRDGGVYRDFFGVPAAFSGSVSTLAHRLRVPILVVAMVRDDARDVYTMNTVREFSADEVAAASPDDLTTKIVGTLEQMIRRWPEQWLWMYRRWKRWRPGDDPSRFPSYAKEDPSATSGNPC